jgi:hypothetical protein
LVIQHSSKGEKARRVAACSDSRNLASAIRERHQMSMRRSPALALTLFLAACATRPQQPVAEIPQTPPTNEPRELFGLTAQELVARFGNPAFQVREGNSLKLQFRSRRCVLDAYLYASRAGAPLRVTHVDTRLPSGADTDQSACISVLAVRS